MHERQASERAFDNVAKMYDAWYTTDLGKAVDSLEMDLLYHLMRPQPGQWALDVGSGTGHFVADLMAWGVAAVGVDLSAAMLNVAGAKDPHQRLVQGDAAALPVVSGGFDIVLSVTALEFVADPQRALDEMWRAVQPEGRMVVAVLNAWSPWAWARRREARKARTPFSEAHFFQPVEFQRLLRPFGPVEWGSAVFVGPSGQCLRWAGLAEQVGRRWFRPFGALLVGVVWKR